MLNRKGMFLISSFLVLSVMGTFSLALFLKSTTVYRATERAQHRIIAFHLAESGVDRAIVQLRGDSNYTGQGYTILGRGGYDVAVDTPDPITNPLVRRIIANGHAPSNVATSYAYERRQVIAYVTLSSGSPFDFGLFADTSIQMSGNAATDSYDSRNGAYRAPGGNNGDVGTNTTGRNMVSLSGNVRINGDAVVGTGGDPARVITMSGNSTITGNQSAASTLKTLSPVQIPTTLVNSGRLHVNGNQTQTLGGGTYWFESINISGNGRVNFTGPATVYVSHDLSISGNGMGTSANLPPNLLIYVKGTCTSASVSGNGNFYGAIYAPDSRLNIAGNGQLFGAMVGDNFAISGNAKIHYDEALTQVSGGGGPGNKVQMRSWQEI